MKASELIENLKTMIEKHGDLVVFVNGVESDNVDIECVKLKKEYFCYKDDDRNENEDVKEVIFPHIHIYDAEDKDCGLIPKEEQDK